MTTPFKTLRQKHDTITYESIRVKKTGNDWVVRVEITEKSSIPESMDVLGIYDIHLNDKEDVLSYERKGMRKRGDVEARIEE